jgi:hypothetical protein
MKTDKQFVGTLEDNICNGGAPTHLVSDCAQSSISKHATNIFHVLCISSWQSEPHQQHQNLMECCYNTIKSQANVVMDCTASLAYLWLLSLLYVCFLLNNMSCKALNGAKPLQVLTGSTNDTSPLLVFQWYEPVYYKFYDSDFPSDSCEGHGHFVGILEHVGHHMTFKILMDDTKKIIHCSNVHSALSKEDQNLKVDLSNDDFFVANPILKSCHDSPDHLDHGEGCDTPVIDPEDLVSHTFLWIN